MLGVLRSWKLWLLAIWVAAACYVHLRGRVRHRLRRQLSDHSTFSAPYTVFAHLFSATPRRAIVGTEHFPRLRLLRDNWATIRTEAQGLLDTGQLRESERREDIAFNTFFRRGWKRFYVKWYDAALPSARAECPETVRLVEALPEVHAAMFALLPPGGRLGEHRDPFAGSLRYHLGVVTPNSDDCWIEVDGTRYSWRDGEDIVFDETYIHSARNDTGIARVILFCDVERPLRTAPARRLNHWIAGHVVKLTASRNHPTEHLGPVNHLAASVERIRVVSRAFKVRHRRLHRSAKYALYAGLVAAFLYLL